MLRLTLFMLVIAAPALAFQTDCPLVDPDSPDHKLAGAHPSYGDEDGGDMTTEVRRGDIWHSTEVPQPWNNLNATLTCAYVGPHGRGRDIVLKIPGRILRCDWLGQDVLKPQPVKPGTGGPTETRFLRVWCTSRP
ncbi:hypothetical protein [Magnetospirillum sp. 15-1]|uniref:hypothetical protein n=1 Tax=Magnetospirillum sp. 15-1 TaxID=1979370 RepID=UPI000BBBA925|nr:hypothetical protein [Magnetospirillum sp. 15-1]